MKVTIFGTGYVGLVQAAVLAEVGHQVCCVDVDDARIAALRLGQIPFYEPGLAPLVESHLASGRLSFTVNPAIGVAHADLLLIAVGTPADEDGSANLQHVLAVADTIGRLMSRPKLVVTKSTVPVGTTQQVREHIELQLAMRGLTLACEVAANPEFLKEGAAVNDCMRPDRIIIGCDSERALEQLRALYAPFNRNHDRIVVMDLRSAELTKYAANAMLATKISFMNEMAALAEQLGADIEAVRQGMGADPRIGYHFIYPGCGYGGSCFPKDIKSLRHTAASVGCDAPLLAAVEQVNQRQQQKMAQTLLTRFGRICAAVPSPCGGWRSNPVPTICAMRLAARYWPPSGLPVAGYRPLIPRRWSVPASSMASGRICCSARLRRRHWKGPRPC